MNKNPHLHKHTAGILTSAHLRIIDLSDDRPLVPVQEIVQTLTVTVLGNKQQLE